MNNVIADALNTMKQARAEADRLELAVTGGYCVMWDNLPLRVNAGGIVGLCGVRVWIGTYDEAFRMKRLFLNMTKGKQVNREFSVQTTAQAAVIWKQQIERCINALQAVQ